MKKITVFCILVFAISLAHGQNITEQIDNIIIQNEAAAHLSFLAADEMKGRNAGSNELDIAANYIRTQFRINGIKPLPGTNDYFQFVDLSNRFHQRQQRHQ
jgi:hypothetical protein